jgi:hypothetical protein
MGIREGRRWETLGYAITPGCESGWEVVIAMAKVIEFYVPKRFRRNAKWIPLEQRGKVIQFPALGKKSA